MKKNYLLLICPMLFFSCASLRIEYIGNRTQPTSSIDVYVEENSIQKPFTIMGKGYCNYGLVSEEAQTKAIIKAKKVGADAILFRDIYFPVSTTKTINNTETYDTTVGLKFSSSHSSITPAYTQPYKELIFLKYK